MENEQKIKVALVRGDSLNEWEGKLWEKLGAGFSVTGICSKKNLYSIKNINFPIKKFVTSADNIVARNYNKYCKAIFQKMNGLEACLQDFDIAHTAEVSYYYSLQAVRAKKHNPRLKVVTTVWDNSFGRFEYNYWLNRTTPPAFWISKMHKYIDEIVAGVDMFLPVSELSAAMLRDLGVKPEKILLTTPALYVEEKPGKTLEQYAPGLEGKELYFTVSRLVKEKGVYDVLYAWKMYVSAAPEREKKVLVVIGSGPEESNMRRLVGEWGMDKSVRFLGTVANNDLRIFYRQAKALILASLPGPLWQEQFGYVLAEAISQKCPVISTYSGAIPEVIENAGLLFSPGNPLELKSCLVKFDDVALVNELKANCERVMLKFAYEKYVESITNVYKKLITK